MTDSKIYYNGQLIESRKAWSSAVLEHLLEGSKYVYAQVNTVGHKPLYLERHLHFACASFEKLYGERPVLAVGEISSQIENLLYENRAPRTGNSVIVRLIPRYGCRNKNYCPPDIAIIAGEASIYRGYDVMSVRPEAVIMNYEIPLSGHRTAISYAAAGYMDIFAADSARKTMGTGEATSTKAETEATTTEYKTVSGAKIALHANRAGNLVSCGEYPIFAVQRGGGDFDNKEDKSQSNAADMGYGDRINNNKNGSRIVITPEPERGAGLCVEYELMLTACQRAGIHVVHRDIPVEQLAETEELMVFNNTGIVSVSSCSGLHFYNLTTLELEKQLPKITSEGLLS